MKLVILAGGYGTRISEETADRPKPMIEIGGRPIIWHIMKIYAAYGICDFVVCLGYKGYSIKEYFTNYVNHVSDLTIDLSDNSVEVLQSRAEPWRVTLVDTGLDTMTGGRLKRVSRYLGSETFLMTYGDGLADVNISELIGFHQSSGTLATVTAVRPPGRFGALDLENQMVARFLEKPLGDGSWINGGFFVLSPEVLDRIADDSTVFEAEPLQGLADEGQLSAFRHDGFWQPMDTLRDKRLLESMWENGSAKWKVW